MQKLQYVLAGEQWETHLSLHKLIPVVVGEGSEEERSVVTVTSGLCYGTNTTVDSLRVDH